MFRRTPGFNTLAVHAGSQQEQAVGARPVLACQMTGDDVAHAGLLEERMAALEGGAAATATVSGHAAHLLVFHCLTRPGDNLVAASNLYQGTINQFSHAFRNFGWQVRWADPENIASFEAAIDGNTRAIFIESLSRSGGVFIDIEKVAEIAQRHGLPLIVDNTMASPYLLPPIEYGADIVVHSLSQFIAGHGNMVAGIIVDCGTFDWSKSGNYPMLSQPRPDHDGVMLHEIHGNLALAMACRMPGLHDFGPEISLFNACLIAMGLEVLPLRMQRCCDNALQVAEWLQDHDKMAWVSYPGLSDDPNHALQQKYSPKGAGGLVTFGLKGGSEAVTQMVAGVEMFSRAARMGNTKSYIVGAGPDAVCLSIGIEDVADIVADLEQALTK